MKNYSKYIYTLRSEFDNLSWLLLFAFLLFGYGFVSSDLFYETIILEAKDFGVEYWIRFLSYMRIGVIAVFSIAIFQSIYRDLPLRVEAFYVSRPLSPIVIVFVKVSFLLVLGFLLPLFGGLFNSSLLSFSYILLPVGAFILSFSSLAKNWSEMLRLVPLFCFLGLVFLLYEGYHSFDISAVVFNDYRPVAIVFLTVTCVLVLFFQYRFKRVGVGCVVLLAALYGTFKIYTASYLDTIRIDGRAVAGVAADNIVVVGHPRVSLENLGRYRLYFDLDWSQSALPADVSVELWTGGVELLSDESDWPALFRVSPDFGGLDAFLSAKVHGLKHFGEWFASSSASFVVGGDLLNARDRLDVTLMFRVVRWGNAQVVSFGERVDVRLDRGTLYLRDWDLALRRRDVVSYETLWIPGSLFAKKPEAILVGPRGNKWFNAGYSERIAEFSSVGFGPVLVRKGYPFASSDSEPAERAWWSDVPTIEWFDNSSLWVSEILEEGFVRKRVSIPISLLSPDRNSWAIPANPDSVRSSLDMTVSFLFFDSDRRYEILVVQLVGEPVMPNRFAWYDNDTLLFQRADGSVAAIRDIRRFEALNTVSSKEYLPEAALPEEASIFLGSE